MYWLGMNKDLTRNVKSATHFKTTWLKCPSFHLKSQGQKVAYGIPDKLINDNVAFASTEFQDFEEYYFTTEPGLPEYRCSK